MVDIILEIIFEVLGGIVELIIDNCSFLKKPKK